MSENIPFYATRMGQRFYEHTLPELVRQITRLADAVERVVEDRQSPSPAKSESE